MAQGKLRRPNMAMMLAVNAAIDKDDKQVARLLKEHDLDAAELELRLKRRDGVRYDLNGARKRSVKRPAVRSVEAGPKRSGLAIDIRITIDGRTSVAKLFKFIDLADQIKTRAQEELTLRSPDEIERVKKAFSEIELMRREREKLEAKIREAEGAL